LANTQHRPSYVLADRALGKSGRNLRR
jgi:hypothetical protein